MYGVRGTSVLSKSIHIPSGCPIDYMDAVLEGVTKKASFQQFNWFIYSTITHQNSTIFFKHTGRNVRDTLLSSNDQQPKFLKPTPSMKPTKARSCINITLYEYRFPSDYLFLQKFLLGRIYHQY